MSVQHEAWSKTSIQSNIVQVNFLDELAPNIFCVKKCHLPEKCESGEKFVLKCAFQKDTFESMKRI